MGPTQEQPLWTVEQAAQHWGVSTSRARAILSTRNIRRIAGYRREDIKSVTRRQGARTDLHKTPIPALATRALTVREAAAAIGHAGDESRKLRIFFEFVRGAHEAATNVADLIVDEPGLTGDPRFDAALAAAAEYLCARLGRPGPLWTVTMDRFLDSAWWISDLPSGRAFAAVWTPVSFRRRGIYLDRHDLSSDRGGSAMVEPVFDRSEVHRAFEALASTLERKRVVGQVHVVGGAAMLLAYDSRVITRDIDALFSPDGPMIEAIREVAAEMGWPATWLNNQASVYVSRVAGQGSRVFDHPYLQVAVTPPTHLLAMKALAARSVRDGEDIALLLDHLGIAAAESVWELVERYFPGEAISQRSRMLVEDILGRRT